ncbi:DUF3703 domain-containing protein [Streptomyces griseoincarnatus]
MLRLALRERDLTEVLGQLVRLVVAAPGSAAGKYPDGNTAAPGPASPLRCRYPVIWPRCCEQPASRWSRSFESAQSLPGKQQITRTPRKGFAPLVALMRAS